MRRNRRLYDHLLANRFLDIAGHLRAEGRAASQEPGDDQTLSFAFSEQRPARAPTHNPRGGEDRYDEQHGYHQKHLCLDRHKISPSPFIRSGPVKPHRESKKQKSSDFVSATALGSKTFKSLRYSGQALANNRHFRQARKLARLGIEQLK
jgi:hypothetical protein